MRTTEISAPWLCFRLRAASTGSPLITVERCQPRSNQSSSISLEPSTVMFCVITSGRTGSSVVVERSVLVPVRGLHDRRGGVWCLVPASDETKGAVPASRVPERNGDFSPGTSAQAVHPIALPHEAS